MSYNDPQSYQIYCALGYCNILLGHAEEVEAGLSAVEGSNVMPVLLLYFAFLILRVLLYPVENRWLNSIKDEELVDQWQGAKCQL